MGTEDDFGKNKKVISLEEAAKTRKQKEPSQEEQFLEEDQDFQEALQEHRTGKRIIAAVLMVALLICIGLSIFWIFFVDYADAKFLWSKDLTVGTLDYRTVPYAGGILRYNTSGVSYVDETGEVRWVKTYEMHRPIAVICENSVAIADVGYHSIIICNEDGYQGAATSPLPITTLTVSASGVVATVVEEEEGNHILFFDKTGTKLNVDIRTLMDKTGYPLSVSFSPDGQLLMVSFVYLDQGMMRNQLVFYNFSKDNASTESMVGAFQQYGDTLFPQVQFLDNKTAVAFGDGKLVFFSLKNRTAPQEIKVITVSQTIERIFCGSDYVAVVTSGGQAVSAQEKEELGGDVVATIQIYQKDGTLLTTFSSSYMPTYVGSLDQGFYYHNENTLTVQTKTMGNYHRRFQGSFGATLRTVVEKKGDHTFIILSDEMVTKIKLVQ